MSGGVLSLAFSCHLLSVRTVELVEHQRRDDDAGAMSLSRAPHLPHSTACAITHFSCGVSCFNYAFSIEYDLVGYIPVNELLKAEQA